MKEINVNETNGTIAGKDDTVLYKSTVTGSQDDGFTITNTLLTSISGTKTWVDYNNADSTRPDSITVNLLADGTKVDSTIVTADANGVWSFEFTNLEKYKYDDTLGKYVEIEYTITEDEVDGYETSYVQTTEGYDIYNSYSTLTYVTGTKTWNDDDNRYGTRPESIKVNLLANGEVVDTATVTADDNWEYLFDNLDKYDTNNELIEYTVKEAGEVDLTVDGIDAVYDVEYDGYNIINTLQNTGSLVITKTSIGTSTPDDAVFTIYYAGTDEALTFIYYYEFVDGVFRLDNIPVGEYTVVESGAEMDGYTLEVEADSISITIVENSETSIEFVNNYSQVQDEGDETTTTVEKTEEAETTAVEDNVQTGDNQNMFIYAGLILLAIVAFFTLRKKKHVQ